MRARLLLLLLVLAQPAWAEAVVGKVVRVSDGDTLTVLVDSKQLKVRLIEIDAPESKQAFGERSRKSLGEMCAGQLATVRYSGARQVRPGARPGTMPRPGRERGAGAPRHGVGLRPLRHRPRSLCAAKRGANRAPRPVGRQDADRPLGVALAAKGSSQTVRYASSRCARRTENGRRKNENRPRQHGVDADFLRTGAVHDAARAGPVLRRPDALQKRALRPDAVLRHHLRGDPRLGGGRLQHRLRRRATPGGAAWASRCSPASTSRRSRAASRKPCSPCTR